MNFQFSSMYFIFTNLLVAYIKLKTKAPAFLSERIRLTIYSLTYTAGGNVKW